MAVVQESVENRGGDHGIRGLAEFVDDERLWPWLRQGEDLSSRRRSPCTLARPATCIGAVVNCTVYPARIASRPRAIDECVLPTPAGLQHVLSVGYPT